MGPRQRARAPIRINPFRHSDEATTRGGVEGGSTWVVGTFFGARPNPLGRPPSLRIIPSCRGRIHSEHSGCARLPDAMTAFPDVFSTSPSVTAFDDDAWEDLLNFVEERRVVPIVGSELVTVQTDVGTENLYAWLGRTLA